MMSSFDTPICFPRFIQFSVVTLSFFKATPSDVAVAAKVTAKQAARPYKQY